MTVSDFNGRVAAITGAGSGIGRALANELAKRGAHLALARHRRRRPGGDGGAVRGPRASRSPRSTSTWPTVTAVEAWAEQVVADHGKVNLIFNNAGVALGATIESDVLRGLRVADRHQLLGRRVRDQGLPAAPQGLGRGPRGEPLQRLRPDQRAVAVGLQRGEVRRPRLHRRAAHGAGDRGGAGVGDDDPSRRHQDEHRPERPHRPERRPRSPATREGPPRLRDGLRHQPREGRTRRS